MSLTEPVIVSGAHVVETVLRHAPGRPREVVVLKGGSARGLSRTAKLAADAGVPVRLVAEGEMQRMTGQPSAEIAALLGEREVTDIDEATPGDSAAALVLALEGVEDPHNLGMILRTALAAGVRCVLLEEHARNMPRDLLARSSAAASECLALVFTGDLARTLAELEERSFETVAASCAEGEDLFDASLPARVAFVIGGERRGLSRRVLESCRRRLTIPTGPAVQSLPSAVSAAVMLFEAVRRLRKKAPPAH